MSQAYYQSTIAEFLKSDPITIIGNLNLENARYKFQWTRSTISWEKSLSLLKKNFISLLADFKLASNWTIFLEYEIPRLLSRIDVVIIADDLIFVIEYKDDRKEYQLADKRQVEDYALDLRDFHLESRNRIIVPILLAPDAKSEYHDGEQIDSTSALLANKDNFHKIILSTYKVFHNNTDIGIDIDKWNNSAYNPTPTIIQAAQAMFSGHTVEDISNAGAVNLADTTNYLIDVIVRARNESKKVVCFVTGVPGAGKTLVGLNLIHKKEFNEENNANAAYFSGNGPLIKVLREALSRDDYRRKKEQYSDKKGGIKPTKKDSSRKIEAKIQNLHKFIKDGLREQKIPFEKIVVFDEAQRCWNAKHFYNQTKRNQNREKEGNRTPIVLKSEVEVLFEIMDKHNDWAVIIALVGNGQEINTGEAGIGEWGKTILEKYSNWTVYVSQELLRNNSNIDSNKLFDANRHSKTITNKNLNLTVSQRSFRANNLNDWVNAVLDNEALIAKSIYNTIHLNYPIYITRDLQKAKNWLKSLKKGNKKIGLITSSGALRLRPFGITTKEEIDEAIWFLNPETDIRSSDFLEIAATEFTVQGLEIDWSCVCWDADLRRENNAWEVKNFVSTKWQETQDKNFIINTYRVLLTRAREGMIIWIPDGEPKDTTRLPIVYNQIFEYLKTCGVEEV